MKRYRALLGAILLVVSLLAMVGCNTNARYGYELDGSTQAKLDDLYFGAAGTYVHIRLGQYVGGELKKLGARTVILEAKVPYTRRKADVVATFASPFQGIDQIREIYEFKPAPELSRMYKVDWYQRQLGNYVMNFRKADDSRTRNQPGGHYVQYVPRPVPVQWFPELSAINIQVYIWTPWEQPGLILYDFRWRDTRKAKSIKAADLDRTIYQIADIANRERPESDKTLAIQRRMLQLANETGIDEYRRTFLNIKEPRGMVVDTAFSANEIHKLLMQHWIYQHFRDTSELWAVPAPAGKSEWDCSQRECA